MEFADLTTLADVKAWISLGGQPGAPGGITPTDDALLSRLITAVSQTIQRWLNRSLAQQDWIETRDGPLGPPWRFETKIQFSAFPVTSVAFVGINNFTVPAITHVPFAPPGQPVVSTFSSQFGYTFTPTQLIIRGYPVWPLAASVILQYTAGYFPIPDDIAQACIELVALRYRERGRVGEVSRSIGGGETVSYSQKDMSDSIKTSLQQHRKVTPTTGFLTQAQTQTDTATVVGAL